jgi:hypothetical protein
VAAVIGVAALAVVASTGTRTSDQLQTVQTELPPGHAGLRATLDPETGGVVVSSGSGPLKLDPTTRNALRFDAEGIEQVFHPDGSVSADLQGRFQSTAVARIGEDGVVSICIDSPEGAQHALTPPVSRTPVEAEVR